MSRRDRYGLFVWILLVAGAVPAAGEEPARPKPLTVGVVQFALEPKLAENRDKMVRFVGQAKSKGCRVVVFPETALYSPPNTTRAEIEAAFDEVRKAADTHDVYVLCCGLSRRTDDEKPNERLVVIDPDGRVTHTYDKLWGDARFKSVPGLFTIDGIPCAATLCADRWLRGVEDLPAAKGAQILFECSNNFAEEWIPDLGWYWYAPRAVRNQAFVVFANTAKENRAAAPRAGHGHSAVFDPDGKLVASAEEESDRLLVATLDPAKATRVRAAERRSHPLLRPFWDVGLSILDGRKVPDPAFEPLRSPKVAVTLAAAQMPCSRNVADNVARMKGLIRDARAKEADAVVFPELAVTGGRAEDVKQADEPALRAALAELQAAAKAEKITVVFGMPYLEGGRRYNGAFVVGPDGSLLTRYAQLVVDRPDLFTPGTSTKALWFQVKGVPAVVTVGRDALWSEIAELAAVRGAQVHVHLAYDRDVSKGATLFRKQVWANLASFRTFTATVNAAAPDGLAAPSAPANGGSALWDDFGRGSTGKAGNYAPYSAVRVAEAGAGSELLTATRTVPETNPHLGRVTGTSNPQMRAWYLAGAAAIDADAPVKR
jgi:predicted amidohydrolase